MADQLVGLAGASGEPFRVVLEAWTAEGSGPEGMTMRLLRAGLFTSCASGRARSSSTGVEGSATRATNDEFAPFSNSLRTR